MLDFAAEYGVDLRDFRTCFQYDVNAPLGDRQVVPFGADDGVPPFTPISTDDLVTVSRAGRQLSTISRTSWVHCFKRAALVSGGFALLVGSLSVFLLRLAGRKAAKLPISDANS